MSLQSKSWPTLYKKGAKGKITFRQVDLHEEHFFHAIQETKTGTWDIEGKCPAGVVSKQIKNHQSTSSKSAWDRASALIDSDQAKRMKLGAFGTPEEARDEVPLGKGMLVKDMSAELIEQMSDDEFPIFQSVKMNGLRGTYHHSLKQVLSRELNDLGLHEIAHQCHQLCNVFSLDFLDFEIFAEGFLVGDIVSLVRHNDPRLKAYLFDVPDDGTREFSERLMGLAHILAYTKSKGDFDRIEVLSVDVAENKEQVRAFFDKAVANEQEGIILRKPKGLYHWNNKTTRCDDIRKVKPILSDEFKIVGIDWDEREVSGRKVKLIEFYCETDKGERFKIAPTGWGIEERHEWAPEGYSHERMCCDGAADLLPPLSIDFREYTKTGKPFHPLSCYLRYTK